MERTTVDDAIEGLSGRPRTAELERALRRLGYGRRVARYAVAWVLCFGSLEDCDGIEPGHRAALDAAFEADQGAIPWDDPRWRRGVVDWGRIGLAETEEEWGR